MNTASIFDDRVTKEWQRYAERQLNESMALVKLGYMRDDPINDKGLFIVPEHEMSNPEIGKEFEATDELTKRKGSYRIIDIKYGYLFVRETCK